MLETSPGLDRIASRDGTLAIVAMDQRGSLRRLYDAAGKTAPDAELADFKRAVTVALSPAASGILLDPDLGRAAAATRAPGCGLLLSAEPAIRDSWHGEPRVSRDPNRDASTLARDGADACKFLVELRPDRQHRANEPDLVGEVLSIVAAVIEDCRRHGLPSVIESLLYPLPDEEPLGRARREDLVVECARLLGALGPSLLKLEYPGSEKGCARIGGALSVPWAVLSAGVPAETFERVVIEACEAGGASGFIAGRAFWKEAVGLAARPRARFLAEVALSRLERCAALSAARATPWNEVGSGRAVATEGEAT